MIVKMMQLEDESFGAADEVNSNFFIGKAIYNLEKFHM